MKDYDPEDNLTEEVRGSVHNKIYLLTVKSVALQLNSCLIYRERKNKFSPRLKQE